MNPIRSFAARLRARLFATSAILAGLAMSFAAVAADLPTINTIAGTGYWGWYGDNAPATTVALETVEHVTVLPDGRVIWAEEGSQSRIRQMTPDGMLNLYQTGGQAAVIPLNYPTGMVSDSASNLYIVDFPNHKILKVTSAGVVSTIAGGNGAGFSGDGGLAVNAQLNYPRDLWRTPDGTIYVADTNNRRIRKISPAGVISTVAGNGDTSSTGDGGSALAASMMSPHGVAVDAAGNIYVADDVANKVRKIGTDGKISTFAGTGESGDSGEDVPATTAKFSCPYDVFPHPDGSIYIADTCNSRIRKVSPSGIIRNVVGTGTAGYNGDNRLPSTAQLMYAEAIYIDPTGTKLYISDSQNYRVRLATLVPPAAPQAPIMDEVLAGNREASVSFALGYDGGAPITGYTVKSSPAGGVDTNAGSTSRTHRMSGLTNGTSYTFTVTATNSIGTSPASLASAAVVPRGVPGSPSITALAANDQQVYVRFAPPASTGDSAITGYEVSASPAAGIDQQAGSTSLLHVVTGLTNGVSYTFTVRATNAQGIGLPSAPSAAIAPLPLPGPPTSPTAQAGDGFVNVGWQPPTSWGLYPVTGYRVTASPGGATREVADTSITGLTFNGLSNGVAYTFAIQVMTDVGLGAPADTAAVSPKPVLRIADAIVTEGNSGTKTATFTLSLSHATTVPVSFNIATTNGSAIAGSDYVALTQNGRTIPAGQTSTTFVVTINGDTTIEPTETFNVYFGSVVGATVTNGHALGTISNDDQSVVPVLSIADATVTEGNSGTKTATFTLSLSQATNVPVSFNITTSDGTAVAGSDYVALVQNGRTIAAGQTSTTFVVTINGDTTLEPTETFNVYFGSVVGATVNNGHALGTISNDEQSVVPVLSIADTSVTEGNSGTRTATFTLSLSQATNVPVSFNITTDNGTATAGSDYVALVQNGRTIAAGQTSTTFVVTVNGDTTVEPNETFNVYFGSVNGATVNNGHAVGTITNDDAAVVPVLNISDASVTEGNSGTKTATFTLTLSQATTVPVSFNITTDNGTATAGSDYVALSQNGRTIPAGQTSTTFLVSVKGDTTVEPNETFNVYFGGVSGATVTDGQGVGTITNDDSATLLRIARVDSRGLYDDIDDRHGEPVLSTGEYASLLLDTAHTLCARSDGAMVVGVDAVENLAVLRELADTLTQVCAGKPRYQAVMAASTAAEGTGFLVAAGKTDGLQVTGAPVRDAKSGLTALGVQAAGNSRPVTVLLADALPATPAARSARLQALSAQVQSALKADPQAQLVLVGKLTMPSLVDLTARSWPTQLKALGRVLPLPTERVMVSPALLDEYGATRIEFPARPETEAPAQVLQLQSRK